MIWPFFNAKEPTPTELVPYYSVIGAYLNSISSQIHKEEVRQKMRRAGRGWRLQ